MIEDCLEFHYSLIVFALSETGLVGLLFTISCLQANVCFIPVFSLSLQRNIFIL